MNNLAAKPAPTAGAPSPFAGSRELDGSEISKGTGEEREAIANIAPSPYGIDYSLFQGSADGATGNSGGGVGGTSGVGGAAGDGVGGVGGGFAGGPVRAARYAEGGSVSAPSASQATSPEEARRRYIEIYGNPPQESTQTTQPQSGGNPNDYIGQWAYDVSQGGMSGLIGGPAMKALQHGDVLSALSPAMMIGKSIGLAEGGPVNSNRQMAQHLASQGSGRDTTLVHMSPAEVRGLGSLHPSGQMPINPKTGLPEADFLSDFLPGILGTAVGSVVGMPWLGAAISGLGTFAATGNLGKGILSGLMSFGLGSIGGELASAGAEAVGEGTKAATDLAAKSAAGTLDPSRMVSTSAIDRAIDPSIGSIAGDATAQATSATTLAAPAKQSLGFFDKVSQGFQNAPQTFSNMGQGLVNPQNLNFSKMIMPGIMGASGAYGLYQAGQQPPVPPQPMMPQQGQAPQLTSSTNPPRIPTNPNQPQGYSTSQFPMEQSFFRPNTAWGGYPSYAAAGGPQRAYVQPDGTPYELARGGVAELPSGMIRGPGGGMDDKIKGTIEGRRDVYLSDGEYVVDAKTIAALGDGSSEAGAEKMKEIVEEIRQKAYGTKEQLPKFAESGGLASLSSV